MKICFGCRERFDSKVWLCPVCGYEPNEFENHLLFSPELSQNTEGFKASSFAELAKRESSSFWFTTRNQIINWGIKRYFHDVSNLFEIGCGTGFVLSGIKKEFPHLSLHGSEILNAGLSFAAQRLDNSATLYQMDARHIPFENEFDVIGAFDVLEHIEEDNLVLSQMYQALKPNGGIILTVPQHDFLWSQQDEYACHVRRYNATDLKNKVSQAGFKILRMTSFVSLLLPLMYISRRFNIRKSNLSSELNLPRSINFIFSKIVNLESLLIRLGINFPMGGSLLLIAIKYENNQVVDKNITSLIGIV